MKTQQKGIISAGHKETATAGAEILKAGGNAYDAAIGAMLAAFTAESPVAISAGGGGFLLAHTAKQKARKMPPSIEEYLKKREAEIELYKTVPPSLKPYYRDLVEKYFKTISF